MASAYPSGDIPQRWSHIAVTANAGDKLEILDSQLLESIMHNWRRWEYPAVPVGISPGTTPVIRRSG
jgi:hypothetical protein